MIATLAPGRQGPRATLFGWAMFVAFVALFWNIIMLPRTALDERATLRMLHDSLGLVVIVLAGWRLAWMAREPVPPPPAGLPAASYAFNRALLATLYLSFVATGVIGLFYGWSEFDREVVLFGIRLPGLVPDSDAARKTTGYLHSALGFYYLFLLTVWLAFGVYQHLRYRVGLLRLLPGSRV